MKEKTIQEVRKVGKRNVVAKEQDKKEIKTQTIMEVMGKTYDKWMLFGQVKNLALKKDLISRIVKFGMHFDIPKTSEL